MDQDIIALIIKVRGLSSELLNPGAEQSIDEVGWNKAIYEHLNYVLCNVDPGIRKGLINNYF